MQVVPVVQVKGYLKHSVRMATAFQAAFVDLSWCKTHRGEPLKVQSIFRGSPFRMLLINVAPFSDPGETVYIWQENFGSMCAMKWAYNGSKTRAIQVQKPSTWKDATTALQMRQKNFNRMRFSFLDFCNFLVQKNVAPLPCNSSLQSSKCFVFGLFSLRGRHMWAKLHIMANVREVKGLETQSLHSIRSLFCCWCPRAICHH